MIRIFKLIINLLLYSHKNLHLKYLHLNYIYQNQHFILIDQIVKFILE
jgi:hypothetical protein